MIRSVIELIPLRFIEKPRGLLKRAGPEGYRDRRDHLIQVLQVPVDPCGWIEWLTDGIPSDHSLAEPELLVVLFSPACNSNFIRGSSMSATRCWLWKSWH